MVLVAEVIVPSGLLASTFDAEENVRVLHVAATAAGTFAAIAARPYLTVGMNCLLFG